MECFLKRVLNGGSDEESHRYFIRFGKGNYRRRFLMGVDKGKEKIKIKTSFELANDLAKFVNELDKNIKFSGKILMKENITGKGGKKKGGVFLYEVSGCSLEDYPNAYSYLLDAENSDIVLKMKKSLPKPGKNEEKIDDKFCTLQLNLKYWDKVKEVFFWDVPEGKKISVQHDLIITTIEFPKGENDPVKIRELSRRVGKVERIINADGNEVKKEYTLNA